MNLYEQLERTPCLGPCEKVKAGEIIKLLGLRHTSNRKGKPYFQTETAREFYECTQIVVDHDTRSRSRQEYLEEIRNPVSSLFDHEAKELLGNFGNRVYGQNRSHVIVATMDGDDHPVEPLYPSNLFFSNPRDYAR
jgi:hypothetical protein